MTQSNQMAAALQKYSRDNEGGLPAEVLSLGFLAEAEYDPLRASIETVVEMLAPAFTEIERLDVMKILRDELTPYQAYVLGKTQLKRLQDELEIAHENKLNLLTKR